MNNQALELLCLLSPHPAPVADLMRDLRLANAIELCALCDTLRIVHHVNVKYQRAAHDTSKLTHLSVAEDCWARAQVIAGDYENARDLMPVLSI